ncbi:MAG: ATP-dependent Clp protease ATP-binding subunit, partial [Myxococcales bacterium]|nr:ATP-dependent Clp protease ATP-binding subunit [Myxococcales bacterium]
NRIDEKLVFRALTRDEIHEIARLQMRESSRTLEREKQIAFEVSDRVIEYVLDHGGFDLSLGARPMRQAINRLIEAPVAEAILAGKLAAHAFVRIDVRDGELSFDLAQRTIQVSA